MYKDSDKLMSPKQNSVWLVGANVYLLGTPCKFLYAGSTDDNEVAASQANNVKAIVTTISLVWTN